MLSSKKVRLAPLPPPPQEWRKYHKTTPIYVFKGNVSNVGNIVIPKLKDVAKLKNENESRLLTQIKMCNGPVVKQFGVQRVILAFHFNSLRIEVNGVGKIFLSVFIVSFILVNLCYG